jgi:amino acid transporter
VAAVLVVFCIGYVAMARHTINAGAFYSFIARGLGRPLGVGAAFVAFVAYSMLAVALFGAFGATSAGLVERWGGPTTPWWVWALGTWLVVLVLGRRRIDLSGRVLLVLAGGELVVVGLLTVAGFLRPAPGANVAASLDPAVLLGAGGGPLLATALLGYVGFEYAPVLGEETREPGPTIRRATFGALVVMGAVYGTSSLAVTVFYGGGRVVEVARAAGPDTLFDMGGTVLADAGRVLFVTSLFAAMIAFHNGVARYLFALGREGVLPRTLGLPNRYGAPSAASMVQSLIGLAVIAGYAVCGLNPMTQLFFWGGVTGGLGVMLLILVTSVAVIGFFARDLRDTNVFAAFIAPALATVAVGFMGWQVAANFAGLLGVAPDSPVAWGLPASFAVVGGLGTLWGLLLKAIRPEVYEAIGLGSAAVVGHTPSPLPGPAVWTGQAR